MLSYITLVMLAAAPAKGLLAPTPLEEAQLLDQRLPDLVQPGAKLTALLATKAELKKSALAAGVSPADVDTVVRTSLEQQQPAADLPALFSARVALVERPQGGGEHRVRFYDKGGKRLQLLLLERDDKSLALSIAPTVELADLDDDLEWIHADRARTPAPKPTYLVKDAGVWSEAAFPPPSAAHCLEGLHEAARAILSAELKYFSGNNKYTKSFGKLDYDGASYFSTSSTLVSADATHFTAEVHRFGGVVRVNQTKALTDVTPCKLEP